MKNQNTRYDGLVMSCNHRACAVRHVAGATPRLGRCVFTQMRIDAMQARNAQLVNIDRRVASLEAQIITNTQRLADERTARGAERERAHSGTALSTDQARFVLERVYGTLRGAVAGQQGQVATPQQAFELLRCGLGRGVVRPCASVLMRWVAFLISVWRAGRA